MTRDPLLALMIEDVILADKARHARDLRQNKLASVLEARLRKVKHRLMELANGQS